MPSAAHALPRVVSSASILGHILPDESAVLFVPTNRISVSGFVLMLAQNKFSFRVLGQGSGKIRMVVGAEKSIAGLVILAVKKHHIKRLELYARLVSGQVIEVEEEKLAS